MQQQILTVVDGDTRTEDESNNQPAVERDVYANADAYELGDVEYPVPGFVRELLDELGKDVTVEEARLVDDIVPTKDIDDGMLLAYPDQSLMFLGKDPTAKDAMPWYAFTIEPFEPVPQPDTAKEALDLLKPPEVEQVIRENDWLPDRHGEWWLLPTKLMPTGTVHNPGVKTRPYGPSPLGNHVPREYAFTASDDEFMQAFRENVQEAPSSLKTVPESLEWIGRQLEKDPTPEWAPQWPEIREWANDILVKGTIRHRDNDHYIEDCGQQWHKAVTHRIEVYTSDEMAEDVHLDYYGAE